MNIILVLVPLLGAGIGLAAAATVTSQERRIHFVESNSLEEELDKFDINIGKAEHCVECGDEIGPGDVGAVVRNDKGEYKFVCEKSTCLDTYDVG